MARKPSKPKTDSELARNVLRVEVGPSPDTSEAATARTLTRPEVQAATVLQRWQGNNHEVNALTRELAAQVAAVNRGDLSRAEGMLIAQAHTLDEIFNSLARRAHMNMGQYLDAADRYMRLALKAQSQCRATVETLATIKNPPVVFAKQANITAGPQQVNNGIPAPSRVREIETEQSKLSRDGNELLPDTRAPAFASCVDPQVEALGEIDRTKDRRGQGPR